MLWMLSILMLLSVMFHDTTARSQTMQAGEDLEAYMQARTARIRLTCKVDDLVFRKAGDVDTGLVEGLQREGTGNWIAPWGAMLTTYHTLRDFMQWKPMKDGNGELHDVRCKDKDSIIGEVRIDGDWFALSLADAETHNSHDFMFVLAQPNDDMPKFDLPYYCHLAETVGDKAYDDLEGALYAFYRNNVGALDTIYYDDLKTAQSPPTGPQQYASFDKRVDYGMSGAAVVIRSSGEIVGIVHGTTHPFQTSAASFGLMIQSHKFAQTYPGHARCFDAPGGFDGAPVENPTPQCDPINVPAGCLTDPGEMSCTLSVPERVGYFYPNPPALVKESLTVIGSRSSASDPNLFRPFFTNDPTSQTVYETAYKGELWCAPKPGETTCTVSANYSAKAYPIECYEELTGIKRVDASD